MNRSWLITGCSSGFGRILAEELLKRGERVAATARDTTSISDLDTLRLPMDVTDPESVHAAVETAIGELGQIDVLVNNAGHGFVGALEEVSDTQARAVLDTNVFGPMTVLRAVLPHMRARRSGHIVQLSSVGGVVGNPGHSVYATSKFALEGMSEALAGEVGPLGIRVTLVEPGPFRTDFAGRSMNYAEPIADYAQTPAGALRERFGAQDGKQPNDPLRAIEAIIAAVDDEHAPLRLPLGPEAVDRIRAKLTAALADLDALPTIAVDTRYR